MKIILFRSIWLIAIMLFLNNNSYAQDAFLPTWRLLSNEAKEQFIAGYLQGWRDAAQVTDVVKEFVKENPKKAIEGLEQIRELYDVSSVKPSQIVVLVDEYYKEPGNGSASLSRAVSAAKQELGN